MAHGRVETARILRAEFDRLVDLGQQADATLEHEERAFALVADPILEFLEDRARMRE